MTMPAIVLLVLLVLSAAAVTQAFDVYDYEAYSLDQTTRVPLAQFRQARALLIVNVATKDGRSYDNFAELSAMQRDLGPRGLTVLAFPCGQFGNAEPGTADDIRKYADKHGATFQLFSKVQVNGPSAHPLFSYLKQKTDFSDVEFNFEKFVVFANASEAIRRYRPDMNPRAIEADILPHLLRVEEVDGDAADRQQQQPVRTGAAGEV